MAARSLEKAALQAGYGTTINAQSVSKLVDAIVAYQTESVNTIKQLREQSTQNADEIEKIVNAGKEKCRAAATKYVESKPA